MAHPIVNLQELDFQPFPEFFAPRGETAQKYAPRIARISTRVGADKLGYNVTALAPGLRAFPLHCHHANEEMFFVLEGTGELRVGDARYALRAGDFICCPAGGHEMAHQIENTGTTELRYLAVSTQISPDIMEYPDSGKYFAVHDPVRGQPPRFRAIGKTADSKNYWDDE